MMAKLSLKTFLILVIMKTYFDAAAGSSEMAKTNYFETYYLEPPRSNERNAMKLERYKWPNGTVPFLFHSDYTEQDRLAVLRAMDVFFVKTCVKFVPKTEEHVEHIQFTKSPACGSSVGRRAGRKEPLEVTYSKYCLTVPGALQHEMFHVLGLLHEQSRPDRDDHVTILWENIQPEYHQNFQKAEYTLVETFGLPYDFNSLMHYPSNAFAKPGTNVTIMAKNNPSRSLGQYEGPTFYDLEKIRKMYNC